MFKEELVKPGPFTSTIGGNKVLRIMYYTQSYLYKAIPTFKGKLLSSNIVMRDIIVFDEHYLVEDIPT